MTNLVEFIDGGVPVKIGPGSYSRKGDVRLGVGCGLVRVAIVRKELSRLLTVRDGHYAEESLVLAHR